MPWYMEAWDWLKDHPYIAIGGTIGIVGGYLLLHHNNAQSPLAGLTAKQQFQLQSRQIAANSPLAIARAQARAATAQANAAARAQTAPAAAQARANIAIARAQAVSQNLMTKLGLRASTTLGEQQIASTNLQNTLLEKLGLAQIGATTQQSRISAGVQEFLARIGLAQTQSITQGQGYNALLASQLYGGAGGTYAPLSTLSNPLNEIFGNVEPVFSPFAFGQTQPTFLI